MTKVAVIGSNGFIGRHLVQALQFKKQSEIFLFGKSDQSFFVSGLPYTKLDFSDKEVIKSGFKNIEVAYYLASETIPSSSWENPMLELEKNLKPFINFAETVAGLKMKKIVYLSSAGTVYGTSSEKVNEQSDKKPFSPYGIVKRAIENFLEYYKIKHGINFDVFRISNVYGPGQDTSKGLGLINTLLEKIIVGQKITIFGDGNNLRNYVYVKDVAELLSRSVTQNLNESGIYNLSSADTLTINQIIEIIKEGISERVITEYVEKRLSDNSAIDLDNRKLLQTFPDFKFTPVKTGILETYMGLKNKS